MQERGGNNRRHKDKTGMDRRVFLMRALALLATPITPAGAKEKGHKHKKEHFHVGFATKEMLKAVDEYMRELHAVPLPEVHRAPEGKAVRVNELHIELPIPDPQKLFPKNAQRGAVIVPEFHRAFLFEKRGDEWHMLPLKNAGVLGTAQTSSGYHTPRGYFMVYRKEGSGYSSRTYPPAPSGEPNMEYSVFFEKTGVATHKSHNFRAHPKTGERILLLDNSHGCVNLDEADAMVFYQTLQKGDVILVLPNVHQTGKRMSYREYIEQHRIKVPREQRIPEEEVIYVDPNDSQ